MSVAAAAPVIVQVKAFGDLVIARTSIARAGSQARVLLAPHLAELDAALGGDPAGVVPLDPGAPGLPALFDVRRRGIVAALRSAVALRRAFARAPLDEALLLFDKFGARERFIAGGRAAKGLPPAENVYLAYSAALDATARADPPRPAPARSVGVAPGSRWPAKALPPALVQATLAAIIRAGAEPRLLLLAGERPDLEAAFPEALPIARSFSAMIAAVRSVDALVSTDSLPAHIAEAAERPVFVLSPVPNRYWLPRSAFIADEWALFGDPAHAARLPAFLARVTG